MADDRQLEDRLEQARDGGPPRAMDPVRRAALLIGATAVGPALLVGLIGLIGGVVVAVVAFLAVLVGVAAYLWHRSGSQVLAAIGGRPADPVADARLCNLVDGLCKAAGLHPPKVRVVEAPGLNALIAGRHPTHATLAVTSGLLSGLNRIELEGVLADELIAIRHRAMVPATVAATVPSIVTRLLPGSGRHEEEGDRAAVSLTRYPPGLAAALAKMMALGTSVETPPSLAALWMADPASTPARPTAASISPGTGRLPLERRIEALQVL